MTGNPGPGQDDTTETGTRMKGPGTQGDNGEDMGTTPARTRG